MIGPSLSVGGGSGLKGFLDFRPLRKKGLQPLIDVFGVLDVEGQADEASGELRQSVEFIFLIILGHESLDHVGKGVGNLLHGALVGP